MPIHTLGPCDEHFFGYFLTFHSIREKNSRYINNRHPTQGPDEGAVGKNNTILSGSILEIML